MGDYQHLTGSKRSSLTDQITLLQAAAKRMRAQDTDDFEAGMSGAARARCNGSPPRAASPEPLTAHLMLPPGQISIGVALHNGDADNPGLGRAPGRQLAAGESGQPWNDHPAGTSGHRQQLSPSSAANGGGRRVSWPSGAQAAGTQDAGEPGPGLASAPPTHSSSPEAGPGWRLAAVMEPVLCSASTFLDLLDMALQRLMGTPAAQAGVLLQQLLALAGDMEQQASQVCGVLELELQGPCQVCGSTLPAAAVQLGQQLQHLCARSMQAQGFLLMLNSLRLLQQRLTDACDAALGGQPQHGGAVLGAAQLARSDGKLPQELVQAASTEAGLMQRALQVLQAAASLTTCARASAAEMEGAPRGAPRGTNSLPHEQQQQQPERHHHHVDVPGGTTAAGGTRLASGSGAAAAAAAARQQSLTLLQTGLHQHQQQAAAQQMLLQMLGGNAQARGQAQALLLNSVSAADAGALLGASGADLSALQQSLLFSGDPAAEQLGATVAKLLQGGLPVGGSGGGGHGMGGSAASALQAAVLLAGAGQGQGLSPAALVQLHMGMSDGQNGTGGHAKQQHQGGRGGTGGGNGTRKGQGAAGAGGRMPGGDGMLPPPARRPQAKQQQQD